MPTFKEVKLNLKKGSAKVTANPAAVTLYSKDKFSTAVVTLKPTDLKLNGFTVTCDDANFDVIQMKNGSVNVAFHRVYDDKGEAMSIIPAAKTYTVKLNLTFDGNNSGKPDTTVSVKVQVK